MEKTETVYEKIRAELNESARCFTEKVLFLSEKNFDTDTIKEILNYYSTGVNFPVAKVKDLKVSEIKAQYPKEGIDSRDPVYRFAGEEVVITDFQIRDGKLTFQINQAFWLPSNFVICL